jgi:hypothetical protein
MANPTFFSKDAWRGVFIAIVAVVVGQFVLAWQYYRLEEQRLPLLEQALEEQKEEIERQGARKALTSFLDAFEEGNAKLAARFLTENAVWQEEQEMFSLERGIEDYRVREMNVNGINEFRAIVEIQDAEALPFKVHLLRVLKVLDAYYIDSFAPAG